MEFEIIVITFKLFESIFFIFLFAHRMIIVGWWNNWSCTVWVTETVTSRTILITKTNKIKVSKKWKIEKKKVEDIC